MRLRRDKYLPNPGVILCSLCMNCCIVKVMGALLAKKPMESQSLNVTCIMENREILMLRAEWSLPSGSPLHTGRAALHVALSSLCSEQKAAMTMVLLCSGKKKCDIFPVSWCFFPFAPTQLGWPRSSLCNSIHRSSSCSWSCWSIPLHCRHCGQGQGHISWPWIVSKDTAELFALSENIYLLFLAARSFYHCTVLNLQVFWSMNITSSCKGAVFKMLRQLTESQPKHV